MKAVFFTAHGGNEVLTLGERPDPVPGAGEVLVRLEAAALNRLDLFVRDGIPGVPVTFPHVPGADGAGVVEALGAGVKGPAPGSRVVLQPGVSCGTCEFCLAGEHSLCVTFRILGEHVPGTFAERSAVGSWMTRNPKPPSARPENKVRMARYAARYLMLPGPSWPPRGSAGLRSCPRRGGPLHKGPPEGGGRSGEPRSDP